MVIYNQQHGVYWICLYNGGWEWRNEDLILWWHLESSGDWFLTFPDFFTETPKNGCGSTVLPPSLKTITISMGLFRPSFLRCNVVTEQRPHQIWCSVGGKHPQYIYYSYQHYQDLCGPLRLIRHSPIAPLAKSPFSFLQAEASPSLTEVLKADFGWDVST
jgi:hypothetical protein